MDFWIIIQSHKWGHAGWFLIFIVCLFLLYKNRNEWGEGVKRIVIFTFLTVVLYYCPIFARIMLGYFVPSDLEYERLAWLFFYFPVIAYTFVCIYNNLNRKQRIKEIFVFIIICFVFGTSIFLTRGFKEPDNIYKIPDESIIIADAIVDDAKCYSNDTLFGIKQVAIDDKGEKVKPKVLVQLDEKIDYSMGNEFLHGIREYASAPELTPVIIPKTTYNSSSFLLSNYVNYLNYEYFVCTNNEYLRNQAESCGYVLLAEAGDYVAYKNNKEAIVYFVRHGETEANAKGILAGSKTDTKLTQNGIVNAKETGTALRNIKFDSVFVSELTRTNDTARYILGENKNSVPKITVQSYLNDIYVGELEGLSRDEVLTKYPDYSEDKYWGTVNDSKFVSPVGATSKYTITQRYLSAIYDIVAGAPNGGNILVVGHGGFAWMLSRLFPKEISADSLIDNASITVIKYNKGKFELENYNIDASQFKDIE